ncbi:MAG: FecR family protein [Bacteroidota bacterium]
MTKQKDNIEDLIVTYLNGQASPIEAMLVHDWKAQSTENSREFDQMAQIYALVNNIEVFTEPNTNESWEIIKNDKYSSKRKSKLFYLTASISGFIAAACLILYIYSAQSDKEVIGAVKKQNDYSLPKMPVLEQTYLAEKGAKSIELVDGTFVQLEKGSKLVIAKNYNQSARNVLLVGSAKFSVIHDEKNPFCVHVEDLKIQDLGTVFSVQTKLDTIRVDLLEGLVDLQSWSENIRLSPGESAYFNLKTKTIGKYSKPKKREKIFVFQNTNLKDATQEIGAYFETEINIIDKNLENCPLSVTFKNEDLGSILEIIKLIMDVEIKRNGIKIEIYGSTCK